MYGQTSRLHNPSGAASSAVWVVLCCACTQQQANGSYTGTHGRGRHLTWRPESPYPALQTPPPALLCWFTKPLWQASDLWARLEELWSRNTPPPPPPPPPHHRTVHWSCMLSQKLMPLDLWQLLCVSDIDIIVTVINDPLLRLWFRGLSQEALLLLARVREIAHCCEETRAKSYITPHPWLQCSW